MGLPRAARVAPVAWISAPVWRRAAPVIAPSHAPPPASVAVPETQPGFEPDPFVDYGRFLTLEGGILFVYKDIDLRLRHTLWRLCAWSAATAIDGWILFHQTPVLRPGYVLGGLLVMAIVNALIVGKPVELYRRIEIRPDGMILEGAEIFWLRHMTGGWPSFQPDEDGHQRLFGIYGTRLVEYLILRRFDEFDRTPEIFTTQLQDAMQQLWTRLP